MHVDCFELIPNHVELNRLLFGLLGAWLGGAKLIRGGLRVLLGGWIALGGCYYYL